MIVKEKTEQPVETGKVYEIYTEVSMPTANGGTSKVLQLVRSTTKSEVEANISNINDQIQSLTAQKADEEFILEEINSL